MKFLAILLLLLPLSQACSCLPPSIQASYYPPGIASYVQARVIKERIKPLKVIYTLKVIFDYKGCLNKNDIIKVQTAKSSAACGVLLTVGKKYAIPIRKGKRPMIVSCDYIRLFRQLTAEDKKFLNERQIICKGVKTCADGSKPDLCKRAVCNPSSAPCKEAVDCIDNFCRGCGAIEWLDEFGFLTCV